MRGMNNMQANICLLAVTLCWSCEIVLLALVPKEVNPFATNCTTSLIAALLLGACFYRRIVATFKRDGFVLARRIALLGVLYATYNVLIEEGIDYFDVSASAFTLSMTAVVLPVLLFVLRRGVDTRTWVSVIYVTAGIAIAMYPSFEHAQAPGIVIMIVSCILRAVFIVKLNDYAQEHEAVTLAAGLTFCSAAATFIPWCVMEPLTFMAMPWTAELIAVYVILGYFVVAFATVINIFAQRRATAVHSTIIYSTEIVFATIWATCLPSRIVDRVELTPAIVIGCMLVIVGSLVKIAPFGKGWEELVEEPSAAVSESIWHVHAKRMPDLVSALLLRIRFTFVRNATLFVILLVVYLVISLPFKALAIIPGFTDVRPVCMLMPVYGIFFGLPGCFAFAVGNVISDIASDSLRWSSIAGFIGNFVYPYLMYLYWTQIRKKQFNLRSRRAVALFIVSILVCACVETLIITPTVALMYPEVDAAVFALSCVGNLTIFPIGFAIPFIILIQDELGFVPITRGSLYPEPYDYHTKERSTA